MLINDAMEKNPSILTNINSILNKRLVMIIGTAFLIMMLLDGMLTATLSHIYLFWLAGAICLFLTVLWITLGNEKSKQTYLKQTL
jgi:hypothetical protein